MDSLENDEPNLFLLPDDDASSSSFNINPDLGTHDDDDDLWSSDTTSFTDADTNGLVFDDDSDIVASCSPSSHSDTLNRRGGNGNGKTCTNPQTPDDLYPPPDVRFRPMGTTKDLPISIPTYNLEICDALTMGTFRTLVACDSGRDEDRKPTEDFGVFVLEHCTPCMWMMIHSLCGNFIFTLYKGKWTFLILHTVDILKGCHSPHEIWCCTDLTPEMDADELVSFSFSFSLSSRIAFMCITYFLL